MIPKKYLLLLMIGGAIIALDQAVKMIVHSYFNFHESIDVIPGFFSLTYVRNTGAAFGILSQAHDTFRSIFFLTMPVLAAIFIVFIIRGLDNKDWVQISSLSSIFGGALGNYIDRLRFGYVVDYLDFHYKREFVWPAFNVADIAIVCGVGVLLLLMVLEWKEQKNQQTQKSS